MANSKHAIKKTLDVEGGYSNDPDDPGKETYCGISRRFWPSWRGWVLIDRKIMLFPNMKAVGMKFNDPKLDEAVEEFYLQNFWNPIKGNLIARQDIAEALFDAAVNIGVKTSVMMLQSIILLFGVAIKIDGSVGPKTLDAIANVSNQVNFLNSFTEARIKYYFTKVYDNPTKAKFLKGWIIRAAQYIEK